MSLDSHASSDADMPAPGSDRRHARDGHSLPISTVIAESRRGLFDDPAGSALARLMTLSGRVPFRDAVAALTPWERAVLDEALSEDTLRLVAADSSVVEAGEVIVVTQSAYGRTSLWKACEERHGDAAIVGRFALPLAAAERVTEASREATLREAAERERFNEVLRDAEATGRLPALVRDVARHVDNVESVYVYIGRDLFARSDIGNTLLRGGRLHALATQSLRAWTPEERLFVSAFHLLFMTGRAIRIEEFNSRQLSAGAVREWLERKDQLYGAWLHEPGPPCESLLDLAARVGSRRARLEGAGVIGFRRVNGVTLATRERLVARADVKPEPEQLAPAIVTFARDCGITTDGEPSGCMAQLARHVLERKADDPQSMLVEKLLETIVHSAVLESRADYAMSSSLRDLARLAPGGSPGFPAAMGLAKPDFFCVVVAHASFIAQVGHATWTRIQRAAASRMQFNRWHFIAGNFERSQIPDGRHYYFPPTMPDVSEWSDLRHPGHIGASVRHTVRAPGPALWRPPLRVFDTDYRGFFDIRLVRTSGRPFALGDVGAASRHCALMESFWREACNLVEASGGPSPVVSGFNYREQASPRRVLAPTQAAARS